MKNKKETLTMYSPSRSTRSESNYQIYERLTLDQSFESEKTLYILFQNKKIPIKIEKTEEESLTIGWLFSETIRKLSELREIERNNQAFNWKIFDPKNLIFLETKEKILGVNFLLSSRYDEKISHLKDGTVLIPRFSGFFF